MRDVLLNNIVFGGRLKESSQVVGVQLDDAAAAGAVRWLTDKPIDVRKMSGNITYLFFA